ncbi:MAG: peptide-methionine (S)-S-oxide reductase [Planctomycetales bacterium]|nr:peptide-methionine (S)-S-oxide reductase [bacterium]UNM10023.1 MAG: peptide-methionine (S)-S-oxide reductase [Planctomycetales bacterium]
MKGVYRTVVGYSGGDKLNPTYHDLGDHTESFEVWYNPEELSYAQLLAYVWDSHDPSYSTSYVQYRNVIWVHNEEQRRVSDTQKAAIEKESGKPVATLILDAKTFYPAEDYHQKYALRHNQALMQLFDRWYPKGSDFRESFTAMRFNAYLQGHGSATLLLNELDGYGLPDELKDMMRAQAPKLSEDAGMQCAIPGA